LGVPSLTTVGSFGVVNNAALTSLSFPKLTTVTSDFWVNDNTALETSVAEAVLNQLTAPPSSTTICGNKSGTACPPDRD